MDDLPLTSGIKEEDTKNKDPEVNAMHLCIRALGIEMRLPTASATVLVHQSTVSAGFDMRKHMVLATFP